MRKRSWRAHRRRLERHARRAFLRAYVAPIVGNAPQACSATHTVCANLALYGPAVKYWWLWDRGEHIVTRRESVGYRVRFTLPRARKASARHRAARVVFRRQAVAARINALNLRGSNAKIG